MHCECGMNCIGSARCPEYIEPKGEMTCDECGNQIYAGERYLQSMNGPICEQCLKDMSVMDLIELVGEELKTA